jgi:lactate permease
VDNTQLPIDLVHWLVALLPIVVLLLLLVVLRWKAPEAGPVGMLVAGLGALALFRTPLETLTVAGAKGVWDAVFILYVVWPALLLYQVIDRAGGFDALRKGISRFSRNRLFLVLGLGWVFASFFQGISGFGTPIAVVAPLLLAMGVKPVYAVAVPLIGHAWANMFGTLAVGWLATISVVDLQSELTTALQTAVLLWIPNLASGLTIAWMYGRSAAVKHALPLIVIVSLLHGGGQLLLVMWSPILSTFLASTVALGVLIPLSRWERYSEPDDIADRRILSNDRDRHEDEEEKEPVMGLAMAFMPYVVLTVISVGTLVMTPIEETLGRFEVGMPFPAVTTGYDVDVAAAEPYDAFAPLTHPGTFLLIATLVSWLTYRQRGKYAAWRERERADGNGEAEGGILSGLASNAIPASVAVVAFLVMSKVMDHSGQTQVLATGIAEFAPPLLFAFLSTWIGVLGAFMTSSNTASNILFAPLQQGVAGLEATLPEATIIASQSTGGAIGNAIAPANVVLGTSTTGSVGREGEVLRKTLPYAVAVTILVGVATMAMVLVF